MKSVTRLDEFAAAMRALDWSAAKEAEALDGVFWALDALAVEEVRYYCKLRHSDMVWSGGWRVGGLVFGTAGTLVPLLAATGIEALKSFAPWGYVGLALAAACFAGNSLFGSSSGHVRNVTAQIALEAIITRRRLSWAALRPLLGTTPPPEPPTPAAVAHQLLRDYADDLYRTLTEETAGWGRELLAALADYRNRLDKKADSAPTVGSSGKDDPKNPKT